MHPNEELIERFYQSFSRKDYPGMIACYHPEAEFSDPVFQDLKPDQARAMWKMLIERGKDLKLEYGHKLFQLGPGLLADSRLDRRRPTQ